MLGGMAAVFVALLAAACTAGPSQDGDSPAAPSSTTTVTTPQTSTNPEVFFPTVRALNAVPEAGLEGKLVLDQKGCLRIKAAADVRGVVPLWPSYFKLDTEGGDVRVLNEDGRVVAQVGERVFMGGGQIGEKTLRGNDLMGERELRELRERCRGIHFLVGEGTHIPGRGTNSAPSGAEHTARETT